jgi:nicotinamide-nucleotide amidase
LIFPWFTPDIQITTLKSVFQSDIIIKDIVRTTAKENAVKAEIIASGTELLLGEVTDTNSSYIASQLALLGLDLYYVSIVGDNYERFLGVLKQALQRSEIVIVTGGLGPTKGDITREVIAGLMGEEMTIDPELRQSITAYFSRLRLEMPINNLKQATLIPSAVALPNPLGSAPGWWVERESRIIISLPGPPGEMQPMWQAEVYPRLEKLTAAMIVSRTLKTWGLSEALIDQLVGPFMSQPNPTLALYAKADGIQLRITAKASDRAGAAELIAVREKELRSILKDNIWGADKETLENLISEMLGSKRLTLATAESFTGGLLASSIAGTPDSRGFYKGGLVIFSHQQLQEYGIAISAGQPPDTVSASRLANLAREKFQADIGVGIDGFLEATEGTFTGKAFIAITCPRHNYDLVLTYPAGSYQLVRRAVMHALFSLRKTLLELPG